MICSVDFRGAEPTNWGSQRHFVNIQRAAAVGGEKKAFAGGSGDGMGVTVLLPEAGVVAAERFELSRGGIDLTDESVFGCRPR